MEEGDFPDFLASRDLGDSVPFGQVFDSIKCLPATRRDSLEIPLSESFSLRRTGFGLVCFGLVGYICGCNIGRSI